MKGYASGRDLYTGWSARDVAEVDATNWVNSTSMPAHSTRYRILESLWASVTTCGLICASCCALPIPNRDHAHALLY
jgi:hypothetical protein